MRIEPVPCNPEVAALLAASGLPVDDLGKAARLNLFGIREKGRLGGVVGIDLHGNLALLRSLAVDATLRSAGYGRALVAHAEAWASRHQVETVYLLTTSAAGFFGRLGYKTVPRTEAPPAIAGTTQFRETCPATAILMCKRGLRPTPM